MNLLSAAGAAGRRLTTPSQVPPPLPAAHAATKRRHSRAEGRGRSAALVEGPGLPAAPCHRDSQCRNLHPTQRHEGVIFWKTTNCRWFTGRRASAPATCSIRRTRSAWLPSPAWCCAPVEPAPKPASSSTRSWKTSPPVSKAALTRRSDQSASLASRRTPAKFWPPFTTFSPRRNSARTSSIWRRPR